MRWMLVTSIALTLARPPDVWGGPDKLDTLTLTAKEITAAFTPYQPGVRTCYLANAKNKEATGELRLELVIHRDGSIFRFGFMAPGVNKRWQARLDACLRERSRSWSFPVRRGFTSAVLPFVFLKTNAPNAGPYESCWDARGCPPGKLGGTP